MFAFNLWSRFGAFRDPITITQNVTLSIPPKTTIGGILAAILGIDYNDYFNDSDFFDFKYSLVLNTPIRKQSFTQNYIEDYTSKSHLKHDSMKKLIQSAITIEKFWERLSSKMPKPKPIRRELLLNPDYLIFVKDFKYENQAVEMLKSHKTCFALYMGNTEFPANYKFVECGNIFEKQLSKIDSFTLFQDNIKFEAEKKYTTTYTATKVVNKRQYRDFKRITISDNGIIFQKPKSGHLIQTSIGNYHCEFI